MGSGASAFNGSTTTAAAGGIGRGAFSCGGMIGGGATNRVAGAMVAGGALSVVSEAMCDAVVVRKSSATFSKPWRVLRSSRVTLPNRASNTIRSTRIAMGTSASNTTYSSIVFNVLEAS